MLQIIMLVHEKIFLRFIHYIYNQVMKNSFGFSKIQSVFHQGYEDQYGYL
jgi:hypothetical protein